MRPNVILIVLDSARADALEPYGAPIGASPVLRDLAERGGALPHAYASASWTLPSHASMFAGLLPREAGLTQAPDSTPFSCRPTMEALAPRLLPEVLRQAGYDTRAISANLWLVPESGFAQGFDRFEVVDSGRHASLDGRDLRRRARWALEAARARADDGAGAALGLMRNWAEEERSRPFFWFVNLVECHSPYLPPKPHNPLGLLNRLRAAEDARRYLTLSSIWKACAGALEVPEGALERMRLLYAAAVRQLDAWVGEVLDALDRARALDDTLIIVTSDHGENLGEGGLMAHAFSLDQRLMRVPFVVAGPGAPRREGAFSLVEVPRAIATAIGVDPHPEWGATEDGIAVAQFDPPGGIDHPRWVEALDNWGMTAQEAEPRVAAALTAATDGAHKLVRRGHQETAFDLRRDPLEAEPLPPSRIDRSAAARLRTALDRGTKPVAEPRAEAVEPVDDDELRRLEDRMRLLGYL